MKEEAPASRNLNPVWSWLLWTLGTSGGWLIGYWLSILFGTLMFSLLGIDPAVLTSSELPPESVQLQLLLLQLATWFIIGVLVGGAQWLLVRRQILQVNRWPFFTALGCMATLFAGQFSLALVGLGMGLLQWLILRNVVNRAGWWALGSTGAWLLGFFLGSWAISLSGGMLDSVSAQLFGYALLGIVGGALTGLLLLWLLHENRELLAGLWEEAAQAAQAEQAGKTKR